MSYVGNSLADGQIAAAAADIYAVPSGKTAIVNMLMTYNTAATSETVKVYIKRYGKTARQIGIAVLAQNESKRFALDSITLSSEDSLRAETTNGSAVDYVVLGALQ